jgi:predicted RNase H-related nuclease YkuK (DUF458 family)
MYHSETYGKLDICQIPDKLLKYYDKMKSYDTSMQIIIGTDSQNFSDTKIVNVIAMICEGHGGIYFYEISHISRIIDVRTKLYTETQMSLNVADNLLKDIESDSTYDDLYENVTFTIHVDAGHSEKGKTRDLIPAIVGWIKSQGFEASVKPDSFVASTIADRISK